MKKVFSAILVLSMLFMLCSCKDSNADEGSSAIIGFYSVNATEDDFIVVVQNLGGVYDELYDENGIHIKFKGDDVIFDSEGNEISRADLKIGDALEITYDGTLAKKNPKTIKALKVKKIY